jgi:amino acid adenylation domain-containing protein
MLVVTIHHIVFDGWSIGLFAKRFGEHYRELSRHDGASSDGEPVLQFRDYAAWQQERWDADAWRGQLDYWREHLAGADFRLDLPTDFPRTSKAGGRGNTLHFRLSSGTSRAVTEAGHRLGATPFMLLESAFAVMLSRYARQSDFLVGTALGNRSRLETESIVGPLMNTAAVRNRIHRRMTFAELVEQTRREVIGMQMNQDVPFEKVVEALLPERDLGRSPLFQIMFVFQPQFLPRLDLGEVRWELDPHRSSFARFDLSLSMFEDADGFHGQLEYDSDLFGRETVEHLLGTFEQIVEVATADPDVALEELNSLSVAGEELVAHWEMNSPLHGKQDSADTLISRFRGSVEHHPDSVAVSCCAQHISYGALALWSDRMAELLRRAGSGHDEPVAVLMPRRAELAVALMGILKAGGAYLPLDPEAPAIRNDAIWRAAGQPLIVHSAFDAANLPAGARCIDLDEAWSEMAHQPSRVRGLPVTAEALAYVIHTSGSSGRPKGVMIPHAGIVNRLDWMQAFYQLLPGQRVLQKTPLTFDVSVWEIFWPLLQGGCLVFAPPGEQRDAVLLAGRMAREQIEIVHFVPAMLSTILRRPGFSGLPALREVICSGEALPATQAREFHGQSAARLTNLYGPTEASVDVSAWICEPQAADDPVPIGNPIDRVQLRVLDESFGRTPPAAPGELFIGGIALARGYCRQPALTAAAFLPDSHAASAGLRVYRTGDRARFRSDGALLFLGRRDAQVKVRGVRIEPAEIEELLRQHPKVSEAVVHVHPDSPGTLIAYVLARDPSHGLEAELRVFACERLPSAMVPSRFLAISDLPTSSSGKVERRSLPRPESLNGYAELGEPDIVPPATDSELRLARLWRECLPATGVIDVRKGFFESGGHSLLALNLNEAINEEFAIDLPLKALLASPSFRELARRIDDLAWISDTVLQNRELAPQAVPMGYP